jgi:hypothetical protein
VRGQAALAAAEGDPDVAFSPGRRRRLTQAAACRQMQRPLLRSSRLQGPHVPGRCFVASPWYPREPAPGSSKSNRSLWRGPSSADDLGAVMFVVCVCVLCVCACVRLRVGVMRFGGEARGRVAASHS